MDWPEENQEGCPKIPDQVLMCSFLTILLSGILLVSCATPFAYYKNLNDLVASGDFCGAANLAEQSKEKVYGNKNALLYYLDRALLLHLCGKYEESNLVFEKAKKLSQEYFTKSVTTEASTFLVSDNMRPYYGEDFERALIYMFSALNYIFLGQETEALVEARQVDHFLQTLQTNYGYKNVYKEDAFVRYLTGMIYENQNQINDAFISYRQALDAYQTYRKVYVLSPPSELITDSIRTAQRLGFRDEIREIKEKWGNLSAQLDSNSPGNGELVVINYNGFSPEKVDNFFEISFGQGWVYVENIQAQGGEEAQVEQARAVARSILATEQVRLAFPKYLPVNYQIQKMTAQEIGSSANPVSGNLVEDIGAIAVKNLENRIARIRAKTIARAVIKFALSRKITQKVEKSNNELTSWLVKKALAVTSAVTEQADKRSWQSLPDKIFIVRMALPAGKHSVQLNFYDRSGSVVKKQILDNVQVKAGKKTFIAVRTAQ